MSSQHDQTIEETEQTETGEAQAGEDTQGVHQADIPDDSSKAGEDTHTSGGAENEDMFPREYVESLRDESAKYRQRAQKADGYAQRLHKALVEATGRLQDASDLPFDESHLEDPEALTAAIDELLEAKPHFASRTPRGDVGQGITSPAAGTDLAAILREGAI